MPAPPGQATPVLGIVLLVAIVLAAVYGLFTVIALVGAMGRAKVTRQPASPAGGPAADRPRYVSRGEPFEARWEGSLGYDRPVERNPANLADRLFVTTLFPLRPSQFGDRTYWRAYLPIVAGLWAAFFVGLPVLAIVLFPGASTNGFAPIQHGPALASAVGQPSECPTGTRQTPLERPSGPATTVSADVSGAAHTVSSGSRVAFSYYLGYPPKFSQGMPLCPSTGSSGSSDPGKNTLAFVATGTGSGFVYFPEPGGGAYVDRIEIETPPGRTDLALAGILAALLLVDLLIRVRLQHATAGPTRSKSDRRG